MTNDFGSENNCGKNGLLLRSNQVHSCLMKAISIFLLFVMIPLAWAGAEEEKSGDSGEPKNSGKANTGVSNRSNTSINISPKTNYRNDSGNRSGAGSDRTPGESLKEMMEPGDGVDFSEGTATIMGQRIDPTQNRAFRSQFETYLSKDLDAVNALREYQAKLELARELLSPLNVLDNMELMDDYVKRAYKLLYEAAEYDADSGASRTLAHMIFNMWRVKDELRSRNSWRDASEEEKMIGLAAKAQFEMQIMYFLGQRRYDHAIMASYFYRMIFRGSQQELPSIGNMMQALEKSLQSLGFETGSNPFGTSRAKTSSPGGYTAEAVEQLCQTILRKVDEHVESIVRTYERGELHTALERMQEVFIPGEYVSSIMTLPSDKREGFLKLYRLHRKLDEYASVKDYENMVGIIDEIDALTDDFIPGTGMRAKAQSSMRMSKFKLIAAKKALFDGENARGETLLGESIKLWPFNPEIDQFADRVDEKGDASFQYAERFDQWVEAGDRKKIFENKEALGMAFSGNERKLDQLKQIVREYSSSMFIVEQAAEMQEAAPLLAWDLLEKVPDDFTENTQYMKVRQQLMLSALPYVRLLESAKKAEVDGRWNVAISFYIKAQTLNPMSKPALAGIERSSNALLAVAQ